MADQKKGQKADDSRPDQEAQHARKIPPETQPAQEWGERLDQAQAIASGGKEPGPNEGSGRAP
jgi:hypothetical protein